jgi:hypothetical protein
MFIMTKNIISISTNLVGFVKKETSILFFQNSEFPLGICNTTLNVVA